jgi:excisionase family DNA binding protein
MGSTGAAGRRRASTRSGSINGREVIKMEERVLLRADEVRAMLGIGRSKVFEMMASGELPVVRMGRLVRVPRHALERWIAERSAVGAGLGDLIVGDRELEARPAE